MLALGWPAGESKVIDGFRGLMDALELYEGYLRKTRSALVGARGILQGRSL